MRPRLPLRYFLPIGAVGTALFGAFYLFWGAVALRRGNMPFAVFYGLFGFSGFVLSTALWRAWRELLRRRQGPPA